MTVLNIDFHFKAIWRRAQNQPSLDSITPDLIGRWAAERGLKVENVDERNVGVFRGVKCIVLTVEGGKGCFPKIEPRDDPTWVSASEAAEKEAAIWEKMEWFSPFWVSRRQLAPLLRDAACCTKERAVELFGYHTSTIYTLAFQAVCIAQLMPRAHSLKEFSSLAREAYLAFYSGYRASSISALIPVVEGSLTRIVSDSGGDLAIAAKVDRAINRAIQTAARLHFERMWAPAEYQTLEFLFAQDERVFVFETFRRWLHRSFFRNTGEYDGATWLNRHLFAHGASPEWQQSANFTRLIVALATLGVVESWHDESNAVTLFFPEMDENSTLLWEQGKFQASAQAILKLIEEKRYQESGRLVPELPTDDGVLLRAALLSEECIKDLVRPLRDAGWSVEVSEPDDRALYVTVVASSEGEQFGVALLYSCATENTIYRELAKTSQVILYRGAPYKQDQFAYGLDIHIGPVTAWQPPQAPHLRRHESI
jgi:hypothetical protein